LCQSRVTYLGLVLEKEMSSIGEDRICPILMFPLPKTLMQLRVFLGVKGYCRIWILGYADLTRPLYQILKGAQKDTQPFIDWDDKSENAFQRLKKALMTAPTLGLPIQDKFQLYVYEKGGLALGMVTQLCGITPQPVGYLKKELDQVTKGWRCLRAMAAVSLLVLDAQKVILKPPPNGLYPTRPRGNFKLKRKTLAIW
jgi:hypothetical protein